jgi:hypothetical protein
MSCHSRSPMGEKSPIGLMQIAALHHTEMAGELAALRALVSSTTEFTLGCSPNEAFQVEGVDELIAEF